MIGVTLRDTLRTEKICLTNGVSYLEPIPRRPLHCSGFFNIRLFTLRLGAWVYVQVLCRILCRFGEVIISHLKIAVFGYFGCVADPCTNYMQWVNLASSVSLVLRRFWKSLGHGFRPARLIIFFICVRRFAFGFR